MTTSIQLPRPWATNVNYAAGPDVGTPTKVDPSSDADGFIKGVVAAPQHVNFLIGAQISVLRRALQVAALELQVLQATMTDTAASMGVTCMNTTPTAKASGAMLVKSDVSDAILAYDDPSVDVQGTVVSITATVRDAATNGVRAVVVGTGGNANCYSTNSGGTWTAGGAGIASANPAFLVYAPPNSLTNGGDMFLTGASDNGSVSRSPNASTVWVSAASGFAGVLGLAVLGGATANKGYIVVLGASGGKPRFAVATDGDGTSFSGTQQPPNAADASEAGSIAGAPMVGDIGTAVYHAMRVDGGARVRTAYSIDGFTWASGTTLTAPAGASFNGAPRLMICKSTGLQVIAVPLTNGTVALYASVDFISWVGPTIIRDVAVTAFGVAAGKLFMTRGAFVYASAGIGRA